MTTGMAIDDKTLVPAPSGTLYDMATMLVKSGLLPREFNTAEKATAALVVARDLRLGPSAILVGDLYVINGRVALTTRRMLAMIYASGLVDVELDWDEPTQTATVTMRRKDGSGAYTSVWDYEFAQQTRANWDSEHNREKIGWRFYRRFMLFHRAISEAAQFCCPDVIGHAYTPDELDIPEHMVYDPVQQTDHRLPEPGAQKRTGRLSDAWLEDPRARDAFWTWCESVKLDKATVLAELGVSSLEAYTGTRRDAFNKLIAYVANRTERQEAELEALAQDQEDDHGTD